MIRASVIACLLAGPAVAEEYPDRVERIGNGQDSLEIVSEATDRAMVHCYNHVDRRSKSGTFTLQVGTIIVDVQIRIGGSDVGQREIMTVRPRGDFIAIPETIMAHDGETVSVLVVLPMF